MCAGGLSHIILKLSMRATTLFQTSYQSKVCKRSMGVQSGGSPNFKNFKTLNLEVLGKMTFGCKPHGQSQIIL